MNQTNANGGGGLFTTETAGLPEVASPGVLRLRIDADQPAWRTEDGQMRVSNLQTGSFSGPGNPKPHHKKIHTKKHHKKHRHQKRGNHGHGGGK